MADFKIVQKDIVYTTGSVIGVVKDATLNEFQKTYNYGRGYSIDGNGMIACYSTGGLTGGRTYQLLVLEIKMPERKDLVGCDEIEKVELLIKIRGIEVMDANFLLIGITEIPDDFDEGDKIGQTGWCNWNQYKDGLNWSRGPGAVDSFHSVSDSDKPFYDTFRLTSFSSGRIVLDLTGALGFGDRKRFAIAVLDSNVSDGINQNDYFITDVWTKEAPNAADRPILRIFYRDYPPEAFGTKDSGLSIEPWSENRNFPLLKWGGTNSSDFTRFVLYRDTSPITTVAGLTPIAEFTQSSDIEYVDKTIPTNGSADGVEFYYMVVSEDANNSGDNGTKSLNVSFKKPSITSANLSPFGNIVAGTSVNLTVVSPFLIKKVNCIWGDGSETWTEVEVPSSTVNVPHIYMGKKSSGYVTVRIENDEGYWSSFYNSTQTITVNDTTPKAILSVRPLVAIGGVDKVVMNFLQSHPIANNEILTQFRFVFGPYNSGWITKPIYEVTAPTFGSYPQMVNASGSVKTSGGIEGASNVVEVTIISPIPEKLEFSKDTVIVSKSEKREAKVSSKSVIGGTNDVDVFSSVGSIELRFDGISTRANANSDLNIIRSAVERYAYVKVRALDELCNANVIYYGRIVGYSIDKSTNRYANWSFTMRVIRREEDEEW